MPHRSIQPPKTLEIKKPDGTSEPMTFADFVRTSLLNQPSWVKDFAAVRAGLEIDEALTKATGGAIELTEETWKRLADEARQPTGPGGYGLHPWAMRQLVPYLAAIIDARDPSRPVSATA